MAMNVLGYASQSAKVGLAPHRFERRDQTKLSVASRRIP